MPTTIEKTTPILEELAAVAVYHSFKKNIFPGIMEKINAKSDEYATEIGEILEKAGGDTRDMCNGLGTLYQRECARVLFDCIMDGKNEDQTRIVTLQKIICYRMKSCYGNQLGFIHLSEYFVKKGKTKEAELVKKCIAGANKEWDETTE